MISKKTITLLACLLALASGGMAQCNFRLDMHAKAVRCFDESNGEATVDIVAIGASTAPYVIQWFDGFSGDFRDDLPAGTHFVKVTDAYGCFVTEFVTIDQPALLSAAHVANDVRCYAEPQGSIDLSVSGGTTPYGFQWSNGETTEDIGLLVAARYNVIVTDAKGCVAKDSALIAQPDPLLVSPTVTAVSCFGGSDGKIRATAFGGVMPYRYSWTTQDTIPDIDKLSAGTHTLTVTDANLCVRNEPVVVPQPQPLQVAFTVKKVSCFDLPDGDILADVKGGTPPYRYQWSNASFVLGDTTSHPARLYRDDYTLEVADAHGCLLTDSVRVEEPNPLVINLEKRDATCFNKADGAIDLSVDGGTMPYSVLWSTDSREEDLTGIVSNHYAVVVADKMGCTRYGDIFVGQPDSLNFRVSIDPVSCKDETDGRISIRPIGGTPDYAVRWSNGQTDLVVGDLPGNTYAVTLTDAQQCRYDGVFNVPVTQVSCITPVGVPNTFTPNGDQVNDFWVIRHHEEYPDMEVAVYNKWGKLVFTSRGYTEPWNGTVHGTMVQSGTYYYTIRLNNGDAPFSGTLTIIR